MSIDNDKKLIDVYQDALDDLTTRYDAKFKILEADSEKKFAKLYDDIGKLETNLKLWKTKYQNLRAEFTAYKKSK